MARIVTSHSPYRYKRPPPKKKPAAPLEGPRIVTIRARKRVMPEKVLAEPEPKAAPPKSTPAVVITSRKRAATPPPEATGPEPRKSAIVTARRPGKRYTSVPDMTPEEHKRRGDGADAMMQKFKRLIEAAVAKDRK
jgi:hypothetical protein